MIIATEREMGCFSQRGGPNPATGLEHMTFPGQNERQEHELPPAGGQGELRRAGGPAPGRMGAPAQPWPCGWSEIQLRVQRPKLGIRYWHLVSRLGLKTEWHQEVRAGQEGAGGFDDLGAVMFRSESEPRLSWSLCMCVRTQGGEWGVGGGGLGREQVSASPGARESDGERGDRGHSWQNDPKFKALRGGDLHPQHLVHGT